MWYNRVVNDFACLPQCLQFYENELQTASCETSVKGRIEQNISMMPGTTELRFNQLQEIEAILNYMNIQLRSKRRTIFRNFLENNQRALTPQVAEKYTDGDPDVIDYELKINEVALIRNKYLGIIKALESKSYALNNITRLRCAGLEDAGL